MVKMTRERMNKLRCPSCGSYAKEILPIAAGQVELMKITTCCNCGYVSMYAKSPRTALACIINNTIPELPDITQPCKKRDICDYKDNCPREN